MTERVYEVPKVCGAQSASRKETHFSPTRAAEDYCRFMAVMAAAFDRLKVGRNTYGDFSPATDRRDLRHEAGEELLDAIVFAYLAILKLEQAGTGHSAASSSLEAVFYRLVLAPLPGDPKPEDRLRRGLKMLMRTYRFRCVSVENLSASAPSDQDAPREPCTPREDVIGDSSTCAFCSAALLRKYRHSQRFCSTDCRMRFHGRLSRAAVEAPSGRVT